MNIVVVMMISKLDDEATDTPNDGDKCYRCCEYPTMQPSRSL